MSQTLLYRFFDSWLGLILTAHSGDCLHSLYIGNDKEELLAALDVRNPETSSEELISKLSPEQSRHVNALEQYLKRETNQGAAGSLSSAVLISSLSGTAFQKAVWSALLSIPYGETRSYKQVAESVGRPRATRAVANACGANQLAIFVPCHRVLRSDGTPGGYHWGVDVKTKLLKHERQNTSDTC